MPLTQPQNDGQRNMEAASNQRAKLKANEGKKALQANGTHFAQNMHSSHHRIHCGHAILSVNSIMIVFVLL